MACYVHERERPGGRVRKPSARAKSSCARHVLSPRFSTNRVIATTSIHKSGLDMSAECESILEATLAPELRACDQDRNCA